MREDCPFVLFMKRYKSLLAIRLETHQFYRHNIDFRHKLVIRAETIALIKFVMLWEEIRFLAASPNRWPVFLAYSVTDFACHAPIC